ncbi:MAG: glycosyltransferase family 39 protein [Alphaproteobacteria bacterium]|nr:glycosyltransferase family 39 protein [Alphaproteobacteria bacterium]
MNVTGSNVWPGGFRGWFFLVMILGLFFSYEMGSRQFVSPDEGRYVEIPREMVVTGDYVTPRLNGLKYFEKPPLFYWLQAGAIKVAGITEDAMRFWPVFFAIIGCLMLFLVGIKCYSMNVGILSAGILATSLIYYAHSHLIILDLVMSVLMCGCLWSFFMAFVKENDWQVTHKKELIVSMYVFSALACMTKGLIGAILPAMVVGLWVAVTGRWRLLKEVLYIPGILVFLAIFLPWHVLVANRNGDFFHFYFIVEHFLRYTTKIHNRYQPMWFFFPIIIAGLIPWTGFALVSLKNLFIRKKSEDIFLLCWILSIFVFFSFSNSKLIPYILPIIPPFALITGLSFVNQSAGDFKIGVGINFFILSAIISAYYVARHQISDILVTSEAQLLVYVILGIIVSIAILQVLSALKFLSRGIAVALCIFLSGNMLWTVNKLSLYYQDAKKPSTCHLAKAIKMNKTKDDLVFCYNQYYQDFPVYLEDTVGVVNFVGELEFGANSEPNRSKLINEDDFWKLWNTTNKRIFLLLSRSSYREVFMKRTNIHHVLKFDKNFVAITNR